MESRMYDPNIFDPEQLLDLSPALLSSSESDFGVNGGEEEFARNDVNMEDEENQLDPRPKRKKTYCRHTNKQIKEMEWFYKECPHPDDRQRKELAVLLGLEPLQVKFWFQNRRTQDKAHRERIDNYVLKGENEKLVAENARYKEALSNVSCGICRGQASIVEMSFNEQNLRNENYRLRQEIERMSGGSRISSNYGGSSFASQSSLSNQSPMPSSTLDIGGSSRSSNCGSQATTVGQLYYAGSSDLLRSSFPLSNTDSSDKPKIVELAVGAMEELTKLATVGVPLWILSGNTEILNQQEYMKNFTRGLGPKPLGYKTEASKDSVIVNMNPINLVEILLDVKQWSTVFSEIVSNAVTLEVLSTGVAGNYNGALQVMSAEFHVPTPLVPTRDNYFVRYCKQHLEETWVLVDISIDHLHPGVALRSRRRASGCLIQDLSNGYSKVTWVEHVEVDDTFVVMKHYKPLINSCLDFGAKRWLASLDRQSHRLASSMAINTPTVGVLNSVTISGEARRNILKLTERMMRSFCGGASACKAHAWTPLESSEGEDDSFKVMTRKTMEEPNRLGSIVICAATSFWLPLTPKTLFDFLRNEDQRSQWDILSSGGVLTEIAHIAYGSDPGNSVSVLHVNNANNINTDKMVIIQESCTSSTGSYIVYAPVDIHAMKSILGGGDPDGLVLIPSGFAILPDGGQQLNGDPILSAIGSGGCLLTVAFQVLVDTSSSPSSNVNSVNTVGALIRATVGKIRTALKFYTT